MDVLALQYNLDTWQLMTSQPKNSKSIDQLARQHRVVTHRSGLIKPMTLEEVRRQLQWDPIAKDRLHTFECGARHLKNKAQLLLKEKNVSWGPGLTRDPNIRADLMSWSYGLLREFSDPKGLQVLRIAREFIGHPARGKASVDSHPYKLGLHLIFINPDTFLSRFSPRVRQTWGDIMMFAHQCSVSAEEFTEFRNFLRGLKFSDADIFHWAQEGFKCQSWGVSGERLQSGCDGCGKVVCEVVQTSWASTKADLSEDVTESV